MSFLNPASGLTGLEPATSALTGRCSDRLNYNPSSTPGIALNGHVAVGGNSSFYLILWSGKSAGNPNRISNRNRYKQPISYPFRRTSSSPSLLSLPAELVGVPLPRSSVIPFPREPVALMLVSIGRSLLLRRFLVFSPVVVVTGTLPNPSILGLVASERAALPTARIHPFPMRAISPLLSFEYWPSPITARFESLIARAFYFIRTASPLLSSSPLSISFRYLSDEVLRRLL
ncbi:hypothetical protein L2E82_52831 [Cichorium intybus]|nr:hypothetical protein L2E82_53455 [Cichorium intybus]KAI3672325.1 hypothetical protein L2E82_52831 [Cichorium intybus]